MIYIVEETQFKSQMSTVLMIDTSVSMIFYTARINYACQKKLLWYRRIDHHVIPKTMLDILFW
jgi:uncharacterized protein with von Willebrand factor type A (vWA) domain